MDKIPNAANKIHENRETEKIKFLKQKIDKTQNNIEISKEIINETPYDAQRENLIEKNTKREHGIGSMKKEIRDIEQTIPQQQKWMLSSVSAPIYKISSARC